MLRLKDQSFTKGIMQIDWGLVKKDIYLHIYYIKFIIHDFDI